MSFKITVVEFKEVRKTVGKEWKLCGPEASAEYAYTPEIEKVVDTSTQIYEQTVEELDIKLVIGAVNK